MQVLAFQEDRSQYASTLKNKQTNKKHPKTSACMMPANLPLAKSSHMEYPRPKGRGVLQENEHQELRLLATILK